MDEDAFYVLKLDTLMLARLEQLQNILDISVTLAVLKPDTLTLINLLQSRNILDILVTLVVVKLLIKMFVTLEQP